MFKLLIWPIFLLSTKITCLQYKARRGVIKLMHLCTVVHAGGGRQFLPVVVRFTPSPSCVICGGGGGGDRSLYIIGIRTCSNYIYVIYSSEVSTRICALLYYWFS